MPVGNKDGRSLIHEAVVLFRVWRDEPVDEPPSRIRFKMMRATSYLPDKFLMKMDHINIWRRDLAGFSFWMDAAYWKYCRNDEKGKINHDPL